MDNHIYEIIKEEKIGGIIFYMGERLLKNGLKEFAFGTIDESLISIGITKYEVKEASEDYGLIASRYYMKLNEQLGKIIEENSKEQNGIILDKDCISIDKYKTIMGKVVAIKADKLAREYQKITHQLYLADGGFGCNPAGRGNAVFCINLYTGKEYRFEKYEIQGVVKKNKIPDWAKAKINELKPKDRKIGKER